MKTNFQLKNQLQVPDRGPSDDLLFRLSAFTTDPFCSKAWINPENEIVPLTTLHYEYFRDPGLSERYGIPFGDEIPTRLAALRVGFVRMNYQFNGGFATLESMRWDRPLRHVVDLFIFDNAESLDLVRINILEKSGLARQVRVVPLFNLRRAGHEITAKLIRGCCPLREARL